MFWVADKRAGSLCPDRQSLDPDCSIAGSLPLADRDICALAIAGLVFWVGCFLSSLDDF